MLSFNCPKCGRFTKTIARKDFQRISSIIMHCRKCDITYGRSVGYYLEVTGEMEPSISEIMENSPRWKELMEEKWQLISKKHIKN